MKKITGYELKRHICSLSNVRVIQKDGCEYRNISKTHFSHTYFEEPDERSDSSPRFIILCFSSPESIKKYESSSQWYSLYRAADAVITIEFKKTYWYKYDPSTNTLVINTCYGRPNSLNPTIEEQVRELIASGVPYSQVMAQYNISRSTAHRIMHKP